MGILGFENRKPEVIAERLFCDYRIFFIDNVHPNIFVAPFDV
jgi:hypothetical protein